MGWIKVCALPLAVYIGYLLIDTFDPETLRGRRVIVTGASTGIGEQIAYHYAKMGARILITARRENVLREVTQKCLQLGAEEAHYISLDMGKMADTKKLIDFAWERFGGLDYLVLNHITSNYLELWDGQFERLDEIYHVNFRSFVSLATYALPMLRETRGSIVVMSSFAGKVGTPYSAAYSSSKFALIGFFESLRKEFMIKDTDISITVCIIGGISTENALQFSKGFVAAEALSTSPESTALAVIKGAAQKQQTVFYPWWQTKPTTVLHEIFPEFIDWLTLLAYETT